MSLTILSQPSTYFSLYKDYNFKFISDISNVINFKYKINYDELIGNTYSLVDTFERFPEPNSACTITLRNYIASKIDSDYFPANYTLNNSIQANPLKKNFRLRVQEEFAYQYPWGEFNSTGGTISNGVSANATKYYGLYNLKLTYTNPTTPASPLFQVGSVVELIDNSNPITNVNAINGIYSVLEVGLDYVVVNGVYDSTKTYYTGSILWSDHRQVTNTATTVTTSGFTALNSCITDNTKNIYTSLYSGATLRTDSLILIPIMSAKTVTVTNGITLFSGTTTTGTTADGLLVYKTPSTATTININVIDNSGTTLSTLNLNVIDKCEGRFKKTTLQFLDRSGSFIPFYFDLVNVKSIETTNTNWKGLNDYARSVKNQINSQMTEKYQLTTDWLTDKESDLFEELFTSNYIYMFFENSSTPQKVLITDKQTQIKKTVNNKLFNYQINIELSNEKFLLQ